MKTIIIDKQKFLPTPVNKDFAHKILEMCKARWMEYINEADCMEDIVNIVNTAYGDSGTHHDDPYCYKRMKQWVKIYEDGRLDLLPLQFSFFLNEGFSWGLLKAYTYTANSIHNDAEAFERDLGIYEEDNEDIQEDEDDHIALEQAPEPQL